MSVECNDRLAGAQLVVSQAAAPMLAMTQEAADPAGVSASNIGNLSAMDVSYNLFDSNTAKDIPVAACAAT